jgi:hypothetical protein
MQGTNTIIKPILQQLREKNLLLGVDRSSEIF